jgi:lipopolysaccharide/colanic/teichoic acid biosynthesis glycosyltransferase
MVSPQDPPRTLSRRTSLHAEARSDCGHPPADPAPDQLDEPQLLNDQRRDVLVGFVISPEEMARYDQWGINLLTIRPGITGLWQVSGRSDLGYEDRVRLDMHYIRNWSIWLDLQLLFQTIPAVLRARGAY